MTTKQKEATAQPVDYETITEKVTTTENLDQKGAVVSRTKCEVYSRVVGYIRPVQQWNDGKQAEFADRKTFKAC